MPLARSIKEFCKEVGISPRTFYTLAERGEAPRTFYVGRRRLVGDEAGKQWLREREERAAA